MSARADLLRAFVLEIRDCIEGAALANANDDGRQVQSHHLSSARHLCDVALARDDEEQELAGQ